MSWRHSHDSLPDLRQQQQQQQRRQQDRCRQQLICVAIHIICIVSSLPQFFAYRLVDSLNAEFNRTIVVSQLDDQLTTSFEYSVVYYWYTVCLTRYTVWYFLTRYIMLYCLTWYTVWYCPPGKPSVTPRSLFGTISLGTPSVSLYFCQFHS